MKGKCIILDLRDKGGKTQKGDCIVLGPPEKGEDREWRLYCSGVPRQGGGREGSLYCSGAVRQWGEGQKGDCIILGPQQEGPRQAVWVDPIWPKQTDYDGVAKPTIGWDSLNDALGQRLHLQRPPVHPRVTML